MLQFVTGIMKQGFTRWQVWEGKALQRWAKSRGCPCAGSTPGTCSHLGTGEMDFHLRSSCRIESPWKSGAKLGVTSRGISRGPSAAETQSCKFYIVFRLYYVARIFYKFDPNQSIIVNLYLPGTCVWKLRVQQQLDLLYQMLPLSPLLFLKWREWEETGPLWTGY